MAALKGFASFRLTRDAFNNVTCNLGGSLETTLIPAFTSALNMLQQRQGTCSTGGIVRTSATGSKIHPIEARRRYS